MPAIRDGRKAGAEGDQRACAVAGAAEDARGLRHRPVRRNAGAGGRERAHASASEHRAGGGVCRVSGERGGGEYYRRCALY